MFLQKSKVLFRSETLNLFDLKVSPNMIATATTAVIPLNPSVSAVEKTIRKMARESEIAYL